MSAQKILFFSPYAFVNVWAYPEAVIAENFRKRGHEVFQVRCRGLYADFCIAMSSINLTPRSSERDKKAVCQECISRCDAIKSQFSFNTVYVDDYVSREIESKVDAQLKAVTPSNWTSIKFDGLPIARFASYEYILNEKACTTEFSPEQWGGFLTHVKNAMLTADLGRKLFDTIMPEALLSYNMYYSCNHIMCALAEERGIPYYTEHQGPHHKYRLSEMTIFRGDIGDYHVNRCPAWHRFRDRPLSASDVEVAFEHVHELLEATSPWVYSVKLESKPPKTLKEYFGIGDHQKVLLITMSSGDERFAAELIGALPPRQPSIFPSQIEWTRSLIAWIQARQDLFLIIRVHPREFPNKREQVLSAQAKLLQEIFVDLPKNCRVNWPADSFSLHDIAKITDVGLNGMSTAGLELMLFGVPVVIYDDLQFTAYPPELNLCAKSADEYWSKIEAALEAGRSAVSIVGAFRWIAFISNVAAIDIGDVYGPHFDTQPEAPRASGTSVLSRLRDRIFRSREQSRPLIESDAPYMNFEGLPHLKNGKWLAYAVENRAVSHLDALLEEILIGPPNSGERELAAVTAAADRYFRAAGFSTDILRPQHADARTEPAVLRYIADIMR